MTVTFECDVSATATPLHPVWEECVGSGHAPLALRADWQAQLRRAHTELGVRQVRFHGLLSDDMGTLICHREHLLYSFFNLDQIFDFLLDIGMRPFVELSFMPRTLASGDTTVFSYAANVTPPRDMAQWSELITRLARHLLARYGAAEVRHWNFEVWNEPNQPQFWPASRDDYFALYDATHDALRAADAQLRVGGPATSKNAWLPEFLEHCQRGGRPPSFVSTHHYPTDAFGQQSDDTETQLAHAGRSVLRHQAETARAAVGKLPLYYTEWCTSSNPRDPLHDAPFAAAYIVKTVLEAAGVVDAYSYWTFSDIFAENYFPSRPFHGGFGLLNLYGIPKPAYRAFELLHQAGASLLPVQGSHATLDLWVTRAADGLRIFVTNSALPRHAIARERLRIVLTRAPSPGVASLYRIDDEHAHATAAWRAMGAPEYLSADQRETLLRAAELRPQPLPWTHGDGGLTLELELPPQAVAMIKLPWAEREVVTGVPPAAAAPQRRPEGQAGDVDVVDGAGEVDEVNDGGASGDADEAGREERMLDDIQRETFAYFVNETEPSTGLVADCTRPGWPCSIAATGMALSCYPVGVERGYCGREEALERALTTLRFFQRSAQGDGPQDTGHHGFYYHFLDMRSGRRVWEAELSSIDTALLAAGMLTAAAYFDRDDAGEAELRALADQLYRRIDWGWMLDGGAALRHGWKPGGEGFLGSRWQGYNEALLLYILALGSPTCPLSPDSYLAWCDSYHWKTLYGRELLYGGPLFMHQLSHIWLDLRGIRDATMRAHDSDYFENSRRATQIQQEYAVRNPLGYRAYGPNCWGISAGDGPGPVQQLVAGVDRQFYGYMARGVPFGPDDGTLMPAVAAASLPFAPELVLPALHHYIEAVDLKPGDRYGFKTSFNAEFIAPDSDRQNPHGWISQWHYGLNLGPVVLMLENHRSGMLWRLLRTCPYVVAGLRRAGFTGGWLDGA